MSADEEQGTYKRRIRNSLIAVAINELVWVIKDLVISYFLTLFQLGTRLFFLRSVMNSYDKIIHSRRSETKSEIFNGFGVTQFIQTAVVTAIAGAVFLCRIFRS